MKNSILCRYARIHTMMRSIVAEVLHFGQNIVKLKNGLLTMGGYWMKILLSGFGQGRVLKVLKFPDEDRFLNRLDWMIFITEDITDTYEGYIIHQKLLETRALWVQTYEFHAEHDKDFNNQKEKLSLVEDDKTT